MKFFFSTVTVNTFDFHEKFELLYLILDTGSFSYFHSVGEYHYRASGGSEQKQSNSV